MVCMCKVYVCTPYMTPHGSYLAYSDTFSVIRIGTYALLSFHVFTCLCNVYTANSICNRIEY